MSDPQDHVTRSIELAKAEKAKQMKQEQEDREQRQTKRLTNEGLITLSLRGMDDDAIDRLQAFIDNDCDIPRGFGNDQLLTEKAQLESNVDELKSELEDAREKNAQLQKLVTQGKGVVKTFKDEAELQDAEYILGCFMNGGDALLPDAAAEARELLDEKRKLSGQTTSKHPTPPTSPPVAPTGTPAPSPRKRTISAAARKAKDSAKSKYDARMKTPPQS